jgi:hypothetical protein
MSFRLPTRALALTLLVTLAASTARAQGVHVSFSPAPQVVGAGSGFDVDMVVPGAGSGFNGFKALVLYDPAALTFVPTSPTSQQQGAYMTGACGNTFHRFAATSDSLDITDVLLCNGVSLPGPGQLYRLHFTAGNVPNTFTVIHFDQIEFYDAGVLVTPVTADDDTIYIDNPVGVVDGPGAAGVELRAAPNPTATGTTFRLAAPAAGEQSLLVEDVAGHVVRHLDSGTFAAGTRAVTWDAKDDRGASVRPGVYLARYRTPVGARLARVVIVR